jgi:glycosyltransferase involved in cell wall biosynthesis
VIKGILFQPYIHFTNQKNVLHTIRYRYKNFLLQKLATAQNKQIKQLFILNDTRGVGSMNRRMQSVFRFLADPVQPGKTFIDPIRLSNIRDKFQLQADKKVLLLFGGIDKRKNVPTIIDAIRLLPEETKKNVQLLIAGKFHPDIKKEYSDYITANKNDFAISQFDGFVPDEERDALFTMADTIVMVYRNFYSSSGIMGHAMKYGKKVIVSDQGLMKNLADEYQPAMTADPTNAKKISIALQSLLNQKNNLGDSIAENFLRTHSPSNFSKSLLQTVEE